MKLQEIIERVLVDGKETGAKAEFVVLKNSRSSAFCRQKLLLPTSSSSRCGVVARSGAQISVLLRGGCSGCEPQGSAGHRRGSEDVGL